MERNKWMHHYINSTRTQQIKPKLSIFILLIGILLSLPFIGCGTLFVSERVYEVPQLPKSELAIIQIDTVKDKVVAESRISTAATSGGENANITFHF